jgi:hypothetical protein
MGMSIKRRTTTVLAAAVAAVALVLVGVAMAGISPPTKYTGGALQQTKIASLVTSFNFSSDPGWEDLPGSQLQITVPSGQDRVVVATFNAESFCSAGGEGWCTARIMARKSGGTTQQMHPAAGSDFAFDSGGGELWEGNSMIRSRKLTAGTWTIWVQGDTVGPGDFIVDDWHFQVDVHN